MDLQGLLLLGKLLVEGILKCDSEGAMTAFIQIIGLTLATLELDVVRLFGFCFFLEFVIEFAESALMRIIHLLLLHLKILLEQADFLLGLASQLVF